MKGVERPDLTGVDPEVTSYIELLETELARLTSSQSQPRAPASPIQLSEPETTLNVITISAAGMIKRTPRHLYTPQRRGGMGVFDLETPKDDHLSLLAIADEEQDLLLLTEQGRAFRLPLEKLDEAPVRSRGQSLTQLVPLWPQEKVVAALPDEGGKFVALVSQRGWVRRVRSNYLGKNLIPGMSFHDVKEGGSLAAACWTEGDGQLFIVTRLGKGIRFAESQVPGSGCRGVRVHVDDAVVAITDVYPDSGVFMASGDGKGTIRLMSGFGANKAPGGSGKIAMKTNHLVGAISIQNDEELFIGSLLNKVIRFGAGEVPSKEGVVQGVACISLRADTAAAVAKSGAIAS